MKYILLLLSIALMAGCGQRVEVPPAHVGKIMTKDGYVALLMSLIHTQLLDFSL